MTARLTLICHAPTAATRAARFPGDEAADAGALDCAAAPAHPAAIATPMPRHRFAGPERRCRETAAGLGTGSGGFEGFTVDEGLRDQDVGRWAGRGLADLAAAEPEAVVAWMRDPAAAPHGGESLDALLRRVEAWMAGRAAAGGRTLAVTHPAWVRAAVSTAMGAGSSGFWRIEAPPLARAALSHDGRRWSLTALHPPP